MKTLPFTRHIILMRHGQSAEKQAGQKDYDRALTPEGEARVRKTGRALHGLSSRPDFILSSSATRAKLTAHLVNESLQLAPGQMQLFDELYEATPADWETQIISLPPHISSALCVGHNPTLSVLATELAGHTIDLEPGGFAMFLSPADNWKDYRNGIKEFATSTHHRWTMP